MMQAVVAAHTVLDTKRPRLRPDAWLRRRADAVRRRVQRRGDAMALALLDDRLLQDIGLCRCELPYAPPR